MDETESLSKKIGSVDVPTKTSAAIDEEPTRSDNDFLRMLETAFFSPVLSLVKFYLVQSNGSKKTEENCIQDFRRKHPKFFKFIFVCDFIFRLLYLTVLFIVVLRGLGIIEYLIDLSKTL